MECIERASLATRSCQLSICQSGSWYLDSMKMKSAKKSFFVKDILGLRNEDEVSQLINERRKEEIDDAMEARKAEKKLHENNSYESKGLIHVSFTKTFLHFYHRSNLTFVRQSKL